jgi:hypothetical protein
MDHDDALTLAINLLRDSAETGKMPSGEILPADAAALHGEAAEVLEASRDALRASLVAADPPGGTYPRPKGSSKSP